MKTTITCAHCGAEVSRETSEVNRTHRNRGRLYCSRRCAGLGRRSNLTIEEKKVRKAAYDKEYRTKNKELLRKKKQANYYANHEENLRKQAARRACPEWRKKHAEYKKEHQARPEWKDHKRRYDRQYRCERAVGPEMAEAYSVLIDLENELRKRINKKGTYYHHKGRSSAHKRKRRACQNIQSNLI